MELATPGLKEKLDWSVTSLSLIHPELTLIIGILLVLLLGLMFRRSDSIRIISGALGIGIVLITFLLGIRDMLPGTTIHLFSGLLKLDDFGSYLRLLCDTGAMLTLLMLVLTRHGERFHSEYVALILTILLGAHLLLLSTHMVMLILGLELISLSSYVLVGFGKDQRDVEGSFKYFVFGSVITATTIYGMSVLYGVTGTLDFADSEFINALKSRSILFAAAGLLTMSGFLFKVVAVPTHLWAPDVYESSPMPVVALFSVVPKLAGLGVLIKLTLAINLLGRSNFDWQLFVVVISTLSIAVGNFSALSQTNPKRLMAYSSIAQTGFLLAGLAAYTLAGIKLLLFYAAVYTVANYLVFIWLGFFEQRGFNSIRDFAGSGKNALVGNLLLLVGLISLTGIPPTAGFTGKLLLFSGIWEAYTNSGNLVLVGVLIFGLVNTVVSLFFYLKIPFYAYLKSNEVELRPAPLSLTVMGFALAFLLLILFFQPDLLMSWINKINFAL